MDKKDHKDTNEPTVDELSENEVRNASMLKQELKEGKAAFKEEYGVSNGVFHAIKLFVKAQGKVFIETNVNYHLSRCRHK